jgi:hypothetical protein
MSEYVKDLSSRLKRISGVLKAAGALSEAAYEMEKAGQAGDMSIVSTLVPQMESEFERFKDTVK